MPVKKPAASQAVNRSVILEQMAREKQMAADTEAQNRAQQSAMPQEAPEEEYETVSVR